MSDLDSTTSVEYREIPEAEGYRFGSDGSIWSKWMPGGGLSANWCRMALHLGGKGYLFSTLKIDGKPKVVRVHTMILWAFCGPRPPGSHGCHWDGDKTNNVIGNLRWASPKENIHDALRHGTHAIGERHNHAKLKEDQVREIREKHLSGQTVARLAREYCVTFCTISCLVKRKTWRHVL